MAQELSAFVCWRVADRRVSTRKVYLKGLATLILDGEAGSNDPCSEVFHHALTGLPCPFGLGAEDKGHALRPPMAHRAVQPISEDDKVDVPSVGVEVSVS